jgi:plasmid stabilization system protein ParE
MSHPITLSEAAREDIGEAAEWYRVRANRLAREFLADVEACLDGLVQFPLRHPMSHLDVRRTRLRRFPYMVLYVVRGECVRVIGCIHMHRDPRRWQGRIPY